MAEWSGRRLRKGTSVILVSCALALGSAVMGLTADRLMDSITPRSLIRAAMPMLYGVDVPEILLRTEAEKSQPVEPDDDHGGADPDTAERELQFELIDPDDDVSDKIRIELMGTSRDEKIDLSGENPRVLIYHTHATEAYTPTEQYFYNAVRNKERNEQNDRNIVAVGEKLAQVLRDEYGISAIHVTTNFEPPDFGMSYNRSFVMMEEMLKKYPSLELFIDVHRDGVEREEGEKNVEGTDYVVIDGQKTARLMFVVGTGEGKTGAGFSIKPNYKQNYALALSISEKLKEYKSGLVRPIRVKTSRYNQHIPGKALLVEVGHNANTLEEALNAIPYLAQAIAKSAGIDTGK